MVFCGKSATVQNRISVGVCVCVGGGGEGEVSDTDPPSEGSVLDHYQIHEISNSLAIRF